MGEGYVEKRVDIEKGEILYHLNNELIASWIYSGLLSSHPGIMKNDIEKKIIYLI